MLYELYIVFSSPRTHCSNLLRKNRIIGITHGLAWENTQWRTLCTKMSEVNLSAFITDCFMDISPQSPEQTQFLNTETVFVPMIEEKSSQNSL